MELVLWACALVRPIRFHDTRHTCASLLMQRGANPAAVRRILRHSDPRTTTEIYGHLAPDYLRAEVDRLRFGVAQVEGQPEGAAGTQAAVSGAVFYPVSTAADPAASSRDAGDPRSAMVPHASPRAGYRARTDDIQLGNAIREVTERNGPFQDPGAIWYLAGTVAGGVLVGIAAGML